MAACIRAAQMADHEELDQLMRRSARSFPGVCDEVLDHPDAFRVSPVQIRAGRALVAEIDGVMAGFAVWRPIGDSMAELEGIFVDPPQQGGGTGADLLRAACEAATASGFRNLLVTAYPQAAEFYRRYGFVRTGATSTPLGPALTMMKEIMGP